MERAELGALLGTRVVGSSRTTFVVEESNPGQFISAFSRALALGGNIFLANPSWAPTEHEDLLRVAVDAPSEERGWLMIPSGGSSGTLKFARHDGGTIASSVQGFCSHFELQRVNSVGVLPLHHVSGFMAWMRSALTGGSFIPWSWKDAEQGRFPSELPEKCCLSLVPTQLQRLLASERAVEWLRQFHIIFVGGGPAWNALIEEGARLRLRLSPCYGATETAAMAAALRPDDFLLGQRGCGPALPHARIDLVDGVIRVSGPSIFRGYYPDTLTDRSWLTGDLGELGADGNLFVLGRIDDLIMTGGKKVSPSEVEATLRASGQYDDLIVVGVPDLEWGQIVTVCFPGGGPLPSAQRIEAALSGLASFKHPKRYVAVSSWPRNAQGKIDRAAVTRMAMQT